MTSTEAKKILSSHFAGPQGAAIVIGIERLILATVEDLIEQASPAIIRPLEQLILPKLEEKLVEVSAAALASFAAEGSSEVSSSPSTPADAAPAHVLHVDQEHAAHFDALSPEQKAAAVKALQAPSVAK